MLRRRLIGVITVRQGLAVQSKGYREYLPLGRPEFLVANLDRWGVDEILVLSIDRTPSHAGPDIELLDRLSKTGLSTPLVYGGGIHSADDARQVIHAGADRIALDALLQDNPQEVENISQLLGSQAIIGVLPVKLDGTLQWHNYRSGTCGMFTESLIRLFHDGVISEALLVDYQNEGCFNAFNPAIVDNLTIHAPMIVYGGISETEQVSRLLQMDRVNAVASGNFLNYQEHVVQQLKQVKTGLSLRSAYYERRWQ